MRIAPQQDAEIIKPSDDALQLDTVHQKYRDRRLVLEDMVEEYILNVLRFLSRHGSSPIVLGAAAFGSDQAACIGVRRTATKLGARGLAATPPIGDRGLPRQ